MSVRSFFSGRPFVLAPRAGPARLASSFSISAVRAKPRAVLWSFPELIRVRARRVSPVCGWLEVLGKRLKRPALDGGGVEETKFFFIGGEDGVAEALGDAVKSRFEQVEHRFLEGFLASLEQPFLAESIGESHGGGAGGRVLDGGNGVHEGVRVNVGGEDVTDDEVEEFGGHSGQQGFIPDHGIKEASETLGFQNTKLDHAGGRAGKSVEWEIGELKPAPGPTND